jgi:hypothetical protein
MALVYRAEQCVHASVSGLLVAIDIEDHVSISYLESHGFSRIPCTTGASGDLKRRKFHADGPLGIPER